MIETLLFDLDNTLLDFNQAERIAVSKTLENFQITLQRVKSRPVEITGTRKDFQRTGKAS